MNPTPLALRTAVPADAAALEALVNSAYRGESSKAGWTTEADLLGGQRVDEAGLRDAMLRGATRGDVVILVHEDDAGLAATSAPVAVATRPSSRPSIGLWEINSLMPSARSALWRRADCAPSRR